ncbi:MAG: alpha/beta hydrolase [Planctomycetes bacterium]|nr:alpha/beta hydrolase [Planctomycetota bacterium]MCW8135127.1 alpha/beta hydrolase [Planctomycetota bacterium]
MPEVPEKAPLALRAMTTLCLLAVVSMVCIRSLNAVNTFPPTDKDTALAPRLAAERADVREVRVPTSDGLALYGWVLGDDAAPRKVIQFMGNAEYVGPSVELYAQTAGEVAIQFLLFDYRGFANSPGTPSEVGLYSDADAAWSFAINELKWRASQIIVWGRSLGGAPAIWLARRQVLAERPPAALILEAPFTSAPEMGKALLPWLIVPHWMSYSMFDNLGRAPDLKLPVFHLHGKRDEIIPFEQGQRLHKALPGPKHWLELDCGHNDVWSDSARAAQIRAALRGFLAGHGA